MLSEIFLEKAFWFLAALLLSLFAVIYQLFNGGIQKDRVIANEKLKSEVKQYFDVKFANDVSDLKKKFGSLESELASIKRHEDRNSKEQLSLLKKLLAKLDKSHPNIFEEITKD